MLRIVQGYASSLLVQLPTVLLFLAGNRRVNGFSTSVPIFTRNDGLCWNSMIGVKQQCPHSPPTAVVLHAAHRHHDVDSTIIENPKLRGKIRTWMESYEALLEFKQLQGHCRVPFRYSLDRPLGSWVSYQRRKGRDSMSSDQVKLLDEVGFDWETGEERNNRLWQESYQRLVAYKEEHGDCCVPQIYNVDGVGLGLWVSTQRAYRKQGRMRADREAQLDAIGFIWSVICGTEHINTKRTDHLWNEMYEKLKGFHRKWGHCRVTQKYDAALEVWVSAQRRSQKHGRLRIDRLKQLDAIGFDWSLPIDSVGVNTEYEDRLWNEKYKRLKEFQSKWGHCRVPQRYKIDRALAAWVASQRLKRKQGCLRIHRQEQLDALGFTWSVGSDNWNEKYERLLEFRENKGHCLIPRVFEEDPSLASWVTNQRSLMSRGLLQPDRKKLLEDIGFVSSLVDQRWELMFQHLVEYKARHGHLDVKGEYQEIDVGNWVRRQRRNRISMGEQRRKKLDSIGFQWSSSSHSSWQERFEELREHSKLHGSCKVDRKKNPRLASWVYSQRLRLKNLDLSFVQAMKLKSIGFILR